VVVGVKDSHSGNDVMIVERAIEMTIAVWVGGDDIFIMGVVSSPRI